jgi:hypothetical protein
MLVTSLMFKIAAVSVRRRRDNAGSSTSDSGDPGFLQQVQRSAAGTDEHETGGGLLVLSTLIIPDAHAPSIAIAAHVLDSGMKVN